MSYHPTFAFFAEMPEAGALADAMVAALGRDLDELSVEEPDGSDAGRVESDPERARQLLADPRAGIERFALASTLHSISFWLVDDRLVAIDFSDFDSELYDAGLTDAMRQDKRRIALTLHGALVGAGALLAYTESADDHSESYEPPVDRAARIALAHAENDVQTVQHEVQKSGPWLVAVRHDSAVATGLNAWLAADFSPVLAVDALGAVYEHRYERPLFLPPAERPR